MLLPFDQHFDSGFGAVADSFRYAADALDDAPEAASLNPHLPVSFLYRHAIELYLKSGIITLHRKYAIPYGDTPSTGEPSILVGQKRKPLYNVHSLGPLYAELRSLLSLQAEPLSRIPRTDWTLPSELDQWIAAIEETDSSSTFFRYPVTKDAERDSQKSTIQREEIEAMIERMHGDGPKVKALLMLDSDGGVVEAFSHDDTRTKEVIVILKQTAELFHDLRAMMSYTLAGGR
jgi:hypothetical protein